MTTFFPPFTLWLILVWLLQQIFKKSRLFSSPFISLFLFGVLAAGLLFIPIGGLSGVQWSASFMSNFSIPLMGLLIISLLEEAFSKRIFSRGDWKATAIFGTLASLLLYPSALGLSRYDTYSWGWSDYGLPIAMAVITMILLWKKNRFGFLLLLALAAFYLHLQESTNLWDYLLDPFFGGLSLFIVLRWIVCRSA